MSAPTIPGVPPGTEPRPWLSIMIPTWRPEAGHLARAVESVLAQLPIGAPAELVLVDDASPDFDPHDFAARFPVGAVAVRRHTEHLGIAGSWNACLAAARGTWVHVLHQDDFVLPGFYAALRAGIARAPAVAAAFCATRLTDAGGKGWAPRLVPMRAAGILVDWPRHVFARLSIQCSAILVRRDVYETLGGFDPDYRFALDWDMWKRIAAAHPIWFHPEALAAYRLHPGSESARQQPTGSHLVEIFRSIERSAALLPAAVAPAVVRQARVHYAAFALESALAVWRSTGEWSAARRQVAIASAACSPAMLVAALATVAIRGAARLVRRRS